MPRITMRMIAKEAGVSLMSVSLALRNRPGISPETRAQIKIIAERLGYQPDPVATELMTQVRAHRQRETEEVVAFVNTYRDPSIFHNYSELVAFFDGARERGAEYGYRVEEFQAHGNGMTPARLAGILKARGVRALLVGPRWLGEPELEMPWADFTSVVVGETVFGANLDRVCNHHVHAMATALRQMWRLGYRRIVACCGDAYEHDRDYEYLLGVDLFRREHPEPELCATYNLPVPWRPDLFEEFFGRHRPDAVVCQSTHPCEWIEQWSRRTGAHCGFACLNLSGEEWSGIDQHSFSIGECAMDQLRLRLLRGVRGTVATPQTVLIKGTWVEGDSTRPVGAAVRAGGG
jgi:DNA-binding LacI/PurR family transcriptional regulator